MFYIRDDFVTNHKTAYVDYEWIEKLSLCVLLLDLHHDPVQAACTILMKMSASNTMTWSQPRAAAWPKSLQKCLTHRWFTPTRSMIFLKIVFLMLSWIKIGPDCFLKLLLLGTSSSMIHQCMLLHVYLTCIFNQNLITCLWNDFPFFCYNTNPSYSSALPPAAWLHFGIKFPLCPIH